MLRRGVDFSEGQDVSSGTLFKWVRDGVERLYPQYSEKLSAYLDSAKAFLEQVPWGKVDVYVYLYFPLSPWNQTPESRVNAALRVIKASGVPVRYVWLDVEDPNDHGTPEDYVNALLRCGDLITSAGYRPGIYTGRSSYVSRMGAYSGFAKYGWPLWHANYVHGLDVPAEPDMTLEPTEVGFGNVSAYGGWDKPLIRQWHGTTMFGGHSVDMDIEDDLGSTPEPAPEPEEPGDQPEEEDDMKFILPVPGKAEWWDERALDTEADEDVENSDLDAIADLHAEPGDLARFIVNLHDGHVVFYHGESDLVAAVCEGEGNHEVEAHVSAAGKIRFEVVEPTVVAELYSVGNWR